MKPKKLTPYSTGPRGYRCKHKSNVSKGYYGRYHGRLTPNTATRMKIKNELRKLKLLND